MDDNFKATPCDLENRMRLAAANLEFEEAARLRDEIKRQKMLDLERLGNSGRRAALKTRLVGEVR